MPDGGALLVFSADVVGVDILFVVFEAGAILGASLIVQRRAGRAAGDILYLYSGRVDAVVHIAFAAFAVASAQHQAECYQAEGYDEFFHDLMMFELVSF